jgi:hypothetical protein
MKSKNIGKIVLSICVALAFIMPISAVADGLEAVSSRQLGYNFNNDLKGSEAPMPWKEAEIEVLEIQNFTDPMASGCYEFDILLEKHNYIDQDTPEPIECDIKIFLDIWKHDDIPGEEIYCTDFEDTGDIYNNWEAWDGPSGDSSSPDGAIDTWSWSDARSHSPGHSMHSSMFDTYLGNQNDYLVLYLPLDKDYESLKLVFWHWMEGEEIDLNDGSGGTSLEDYGFVEYSYNGVDWTELSERYYDNSTWDEITLWIDDSAGEDDIYIRFNWHSGPVCQYEGWYIDDVCLYGYEEADWGTRVFDTYTPHIITVPADVGEFNYIFDEEYCFEEGNYSIRIWVLTETPKCISLHPQDDPFWYNFTVDDIYDIAVTANDFEITNDECDGGDLIVTGEVCNVGTLDAEDVQVTFTIQEQIIETAFESFVEEDDFSDWQLSYIAFDDDSSSDPDNIDWVVTEFDSYSPTHSWTVYNETINGVKEQACGIFTPFVEPFAGDPVAMDFTVKAKYNLIDASMMVKPSFLADTYYWAFDGAIGGDPDTRFSIFKGPASSGWTEWSFNKWLTDYDNYWEQRYWGPQDDFIEILHLFNERYGPDGLDVEDFTEIRLGYYFLAESAYSGGVAGLFLDDYKLTKINPGAERYSETITIPFLAVGECVEVEFMWEDMPTGNFIEEKCVPPDDNNDNNCMSGSFEIWSDIDCADEIEMESQDLTTAEYNHWHIISSGYDNYLWAGDDATCTYNDSYNDPLCVTNAGNASWDMTGYSTFTLEFDEYCEVEEGADYGLIEINPAVSEPGSQWYSYIVPPAILLTEDFSGSFPPAGWSTTAWSGTQTWEGNTVGDRWADSLMDNGDAAQTTYANADSDHHSTLLLDTSLFTPSIDCSISPLYEVHMFTVWGNYNNQETSQIWVLSDGGATAEEFIVDLAAIVPTSGSPWWFGPGGLTFTFDPTGYTGDTSQTVIEFYYANSATWQMFFRFNDFSIGSLLDPLMPAQADYDWQHTVFTIDENFHLDYFMNPYTDDTFANEIGTDFTDDMGIRFRFISDEGTNYRGWLLDDISLMFDSDVMIDADPADDQTNFISCGLNGGDWWHFDGVDTWCNEDQISGIIPNGIDNALVWDTSVPQAMAAEISFEHDYDLADNDYVYLEFSTDGGDSWTAPLRFGGNSGGWVPIELDMSAFTGDNVLVRWRVNTNET